MRIVVTTTLNNNLFHAKLVPLLNSRADLKIIVVSDRHGPDYERTSWVWPKGIWRFFGRLGGRLLLLAREIFHPRTKLVMAYSLVPHGLFAVYLARLRRIPVFVHFIAGPAEIRFAHNTDVSDNRVIARSAQPEKLERYSRRIALRADRIYVPGSNTHAFLVEEGFDASRVTQLHSAVDPRVFYPTSQLRDIDVLVCAQLRERKRPLFTLEIFREIHSRRPNTRFCWLGDGIMHEEFAEAMDELLFRERVEWLRTDEVAPYYRRARVFLLCSINEGLSLASMEAMACGVVPVVSDCGDMSDVVLDGKTGRLLPIEFRASEYADAVLSYLDDESLRQRHAAAAMNIISQEHSFERVEQDWRRIFREQKRNRLLC